MLPTKQITIKGRLLTISPRISADVLRLAEVVKRNGDRERDLAFILSIAASAVSDALRAAFKSTSILHPVRYIKALIGLYYTPTVILSKCSVGEILEAQKAVDTLENGELKKKVETPGNP